jgi:GTP-binding protein
VHLIDLDPASGRDPLEDYRVVQKELAAYSDALAARPQVVAANKTELPGAEERVQALRRFCESEGLPFHAISAVTGLGLRGLVVDLAARLREPEP